MAECRTLTESWLLTLRAERKSAETLKAYSTGVRQFLAWCDTVDVVPLLKASLSAWTLALLDLGQTPATVTSRQLAVRRFAAWLEEEQEISSDPFLGVRSPKIDTAVVEPLSEDELRRCRRARWRVAWTRRCRFVDGGMRRSSG